MHYLLYNNSLGLCVLALSNIVHACTHVYVLVYNNLIIDFTKPLSVYIKRQYVRMFCCFM